MGGGGWRTAGVCFHKEATEAQHDYCEVKRQMTSGLVTRQGTRAVSLVGLQKQSVPLLSSHLRVGQLAEVRGEVEPHTLSGPRERHSTDEDDEEQQVGECSCEVDHLETNTKGQFGFFFFFSSNHVTIKRHYTLLSSTVQLKLWINGHKNPFSTYRYGYHGRLELIYGHLTLFRCQTTGWRWGEHTPFGQKENFQPGKIHLRVDDCTHAEGSLPFLWI